MQKNALMTTAKLGGPVMPVSRKCDRFNLCRDMMLVEIKNNPIFLKNSRGGGKLYMNVYFSAGCGMLSITISEVWFTDSI